MRHFPDEASALAAVADGISGAANSGAHTVQLHNQSGKMSDQLRETGQLSE